MQRAEQGVDVADVAKSYASIYKMKLSKVMSNLVPDPFTMHVYDDLAKIERNRFQRLYETAQDVTVFQSWDWIRTCLEQEANTRSECLLVAIDGGPPGRELIALAPMIKTGCTLTFIGTGKNDYNTFLVDSEYPQLYSLLLNCILSLKGVRVTNLREMQERSKLCIEVSSSTMRLIEREKTSCPALNLKDHDLVRKLLNKRNSKRKARDLSKHGDLFVEHITDKDRAFLLLDEMFAQHITRQEDKGGKSKFTDQTEQDFFRNLVIDSNELEFCLTIVYVGTEVAATHLGFVSGKVFYWYTPTFDKRFSKSSPGEVCLVEVLRWCVDRELEVFDFTRGSESYKFRFSNVVNFSRNFDLYHSFTEYFPAVVIEFLRNVKNKVFNYC